MKEELWNIDVYIDFINFSFAHNDHRSNESSGHVCGFLLSKKGFQQAHNNAQLDVKYLVVCGDMCTVCVELHSSRVVGLPTR